MFIEIKIKNLQSGEIIPVKIENGCSTFLPNESMLSKIDFVKGTTDLLLKFGKAIRKYANKDHEILEIKTDNGFIAEQLMKRGYKVNLGDLE